MPGFIPDEDMDEAYRGAAMYVFPSLFEGFGLSLIEAMHYGIPCACSDCSSLGTLYLPATLTKIEASAFSNVGALKIFYAGTEEQWQNITVANNNDALKTAEITYNYK